MHATLSNCARDELRSSPSPPSLRPHSAVCFNFSVSPLAPLLSFTSSAQTLLHCPNSPPELVCHHLSKRASARPRPAANGRTNGQTDRRGRGRRRRSSPRRRREGAGACRLGCCCCCCDSNRRMRDSTAQTWSLEKKTGGGGSGAKSGMSNSSRSAREAVRILKIASVWCKCIHFRNLSHVVDQVRRTII